MVRLFIALIAATSLLLTACDDGPDENLPASSGSSTIAPTTETASDVIFCPQIGVPGEATPSSPTPEPSCEPGDHFTAPPGVRMTIAEPPALPPDLGALTAFYEIDSDQAIAGTIGVPSLFPNDGSISVFVREGTVAWYTYEAEQWIRLDSTISAVQSADSSAALFTGAFDPIPSNLILLAAQ